MCILFCVCMIVYLSFCYCISFFFVQFLVYSTDCMLPLGIIIHSFIYDPLFGSHNLCIEVLNLDVDFAGCGSLMKKCVQCRSPIEKMVSFVVCCGGQRKSNTWCIYWSYVALHCDYCCYSYNNISLRSCFCLTVSTVMSLSFNEYIFTSAMMCCKLLLGLWNINDNV